MSAHNHQPFVARVGGILSADIAMPEHERAQRFYARVLGTGAAALWREDLMNNRGTPIIGLGARSPELAHLPLQWMPHIQVSDVAASVERACALGGSVCMQADDPAETGQWAALVDPNGAAFGVIPVLAEALLPAGEDAAPPLGHIAWTDLTVEDAGVTRDFYRQVIGWTVHEVAMEDAGAPYADYSMLGGDGRPAAGVCNARGVNQGLPPVWLLYLPVGDLDESLLRAEREGGTVLKKHSPEDGSGAYAVLNDPAGVAFALMEGSNSA